MIVLWWKLLAGMTVVRMADSLRISGLACVCHYGSLELCRSFFTANVLVIVVVMRVSATSRDGLEVAFLGVHVAQIYC